MLHNSSYGAPERTLLASRAQQPSYSPFNVLQSPVFRDADFVALLSALRMTGGLARSTEVLDRLARRRSNTRPTAMPQIEDGDLIKFEWGSMQWLPMFQFERDTMVVNKDVRAVTSYLCDFMDGWELTHWFVSAHAALNGCLPLDAISDELDSVVNAARLDRYIALG